MGDEDGDGIDRIGQSGNSSLLSYPSCSLVGYDGVGGFSLVTDAARTARTPRIGCATDRLVFSKLQPLLMVQYNNAHHLLLASKA